MCPRPASAFSSRGFTLIELLLVVVIVAVLATLAFPLFGLFRERARDVSCIANLRLLYVGASSYLLDNDYVWPQMPTTVDISTDEEPMWKWWTETLIPYGVSKHHWICASEAASHKEKYSLTSDFYGSYIPTDFDPVPNTAFMWGTQPWFIERGQFHGPDHGPNIVMPDGTVRQGPSLFPK